MNSNCIVKNKKSLSVSLFFIILAALFLFIFSSFTLMDHKAETTPAASAYTISGSAITNESQFKALRGTSTSKYLANDIILTNTTGVDSSSTAYSGTLYGNGKTITINMSYSLQQVSGTIGLLFSFLSGTVRDCTIVLNGNVSFYDYSSTGTSYTTIQGIVCGELNTGTITNVNVIVNGAFNFIGRDTGSNSTINPDKGGTGALVGGFAGFTRGGTISDCYLINNNIIYGGAEDDHGNNDEGTSTRVCVGGFVGEVAASKTLNMTNIAINGAANSIICANSGVSGHNAIRAGGIIGQVRNGATVNITGLDYKYKGYVVARNGDYANFIVGRAWSNTTIAVNGVVYSNYLWAHAFSNTSKLTRDRDHITPMDFGSTGFNGTWVFPAYASGMTHVWPLQPDNIIAKMVGGITTGYTLINPTFDDGSVDFIVYNNASETDSHTVLTFDGISNNGHNSATLAGNFHGMAGSPIYTWNEAGFHTRIQMGLGTQSPLNMFGSNFNIWGNGFNKTLYITGNAKASGPFLFNLGPEGLSPIVEFNVNASSAGFPIVDQSNTVGGSIKVTGGTYTGDEGSGVFHIIGVTPITVTGGTITSNLSSGGRGILLSGSASAYLSGCTITSSGGNAVYSQSYGALSISGGTYNGAYSVYYLSTVSSFTLSSNPYLNGTTADIYAGKQITASSFTGGAYTLTWAGSTSRGTTAVSGTSQTSKFNLTNSDLALYASGSNIKIGKISNVTYYGVKSTSGLVTNYVEGVGETLTAPGASNIAAGLTYVGMYTSSAFSTSISSISTSTTGTVNIFVKKTLNYSINASATSRTYGDGNITLSASTSAATSNLTYSWKKNSNTYSTASTVSLSLVEHSGTYGLTLVYTETSGSYTLVSNGTTSNKVITISKRQLTISGLDAVDRAYNNTSAVSLTGGTLVNYKDGDGTSGNSLLGFNRGSASISSVSVGTYTVSGINVTLTGSKAANYQLTQPTGINVVISAKSLATDLTIGSVSNVTYKGSAHTPKPQLSDSIQTLVENTHFTYSYSNHTNAGTATVTMTGKGNYSGSRSVNFTINTKNLSSGIEIGEIADFYYSGSAKTPTPSLIYTQYSKVLTNGTSSSGDCWFTYLNNINVGTATITANGRGNYSGELSATFTILKADVSISISSLSALTYGQTLADSTINGTAVNTQENSVVVSGSWSFVLPHTTKPDVGISTFEVSFTPEMSGGYNTPANVSANLTVSKNIPILSGVTASFVEYRREVSTSVLSGIAKNSYDNTVVEGTWSFAQPSEIAYNATTYQAIFYPTDTERYQTAPTSVIVFVVPRLLTVTDFDAVDRAYDSTTTITVFSYTLNGIYGSESVSIYAAGTISNANASDTAYMVQITAFELAGEDKDNYYINEYDDTVDVVISPLTIEFSADYYSKTYGDFDPVFLKVIDSTTADGELAILFGRDTTGTDKQNVGIYDFNTVQLETPNSNYNVIFAIDGGKDKFAINPYSLVVTASNYSKTYGDVDPAFNEDFDGVYEETVNVTYTREASNNAGTYSFISVSLTEPNANYTVSFATDGGKDKFVISPYALIVNAKSYSKTYGEVDPEFTEDFDGAYEETVNVTYTREASNDVGTYSFLSVSLTEPNENHTVSFDTNGGKDKFVINPYELIVNAKSYSKTYGEADPEFTEDFVCAYDEIINVTYTREASNDVGTYSFLSVSLTEPNANYTVSFATDGGKDKFVISPYALIVNAKSYSKTYGEADPEFTEDFVCAYDEIINVTYTREASNDVGTYSFLSVSLTEPNENHTVSFDTNGGKDKFVINPYELIVNAKSYSKTYGEADPEFTEDFDGAYEEIVNVTYTREASNNVGTYSFLSVSLTEPNENYTVSFATGGGKDKFVISPYALIVNASNYSKTYGDADPIFTEDFVCAYDEIINIIYTRETGNNVGTYSLLSVSLTEVNANYTVSFDTNGGKDKFAINQYELIVTASNYSKTYGEVDPIFTENFVCAYDESVNVTYTRETGNNVGTYSFSSVALTETNANYTVSFATDGGKDKFVISPYALIVNAKSYSKTYGEADPEFIEDFDGAYEETVNVIYTREASNNAGTYSFSSVALTETNANYTVSFATDGGKDKFVISPYALIVTASNYSKTYGEVDPIFTENFVCAYDESVNVTYTRETVNNVGTYSFSSVALTETNANYIVSFDTNGGKDKFVISPYALIVNAKSYSKTYGEADPEFIEDFDGAYEETVNVIYTREASNNAGTYSFISVALTEPNENYTVSFATGGGKDKFAINQYELIVTASNYSKTYGEADPIFTENFVCAYDEIINVTYTREANNNVGTYSFSSVALTETNANYTVSFATDGGKDKFVISPYALIVTASNYSKTYGEVDPIFTENFVCAYDESVNVTYTRETVNNVGTYSFSSVALTETNANYIVSFDTNGGKDKFVISPYALIVNAKSYSKTYGDADPIFTEDFVCAYDEIINVTYTRETGNKVGTYSFLSVSLTEPNENYTVSFDTNGGKDKFVINPYELIVNAKSYSKTYGEADPEFIEDFDGAYEETVNVIYTREANNNVGTYSFISVALTEPNENYTVSFATGGGKDKFAINQYELIVNAKSYSKTYGEADPEFTEDFDGVYEETVNVTYTREANNNVGTYSFSSVALTETNANYTVSFATDGGKDKFVISPYALIVSASNFHKIYGEVDPEFTEDFVCAYDEIINIIYTRETGNNAGTYSLLSVSLTEPNENYTVSFDTNGGKDKFVINPYALIVNASNYSKTYGDADPEFTEDFVCAYDEIINVTYKREASNKVGTYSFLSVSLTEPNENYTVSFDTNGGKDKFVINPYELIVNAKSYSKTYGDADPEFTEDFVCAYDEIINVTYKREASNKVGTYSFLSVSLTEPNENYTVSFDTNGGKDKFVINPYELIVNAKSYSKTYGEADPEFTEDFDGVYEETVNVTYTREANNNVGTYSFISVALTEPNENYTVSFDTNGGKDKFVINPYALIVSASNFHKIYGEVDPEFTEDFVCAYDEIINIIYTRETGNNAGTYSLLSVSLTEPNENYTVSFDTNGGKDKFVINPYALIVNASNYSKTYGEVDPIFTENFVCAYDESVNVTYTRETGNNVGTYSFLSVSLTEPNENYTVSFDTNGGKDKFVINPYELIVNAKSYSKTYGEADPEFTEDFDGVYEETVNVTYTREANNNVGTYSFSSVALTETNANYTVSFATGGGKDKFVISPYALIVSASNFHKIYGEVDPEFTEDFDGVYEETVNVTYTRETGNNAGKYSLLSVSLTEPNANYTVSFAIDGGMDKFVISPYELIINAKSYSKTYGEIDPEFIEDFVCAYDEIINVTYTREASNNVGTYSFLSVSLTEPNANYTVSFATDGGMDKFVINPYELIVNAKSYSKTYGEADPEFTEDFDGVYEETVNVTYTREANNNVGTYSFSSVALTETNANYTVSFATGGGKDKFVISPYALIVSASNFHKIYGEVDPEFTEDFDGVYEETVNVTYTRETGNNAGKYSLLSVSLTEPNANYTVSFAIDGGMDKFVISPYELIINAKSYSKTYGEIDPEFIEDFVCAYDEIINVTYTREASNNVGTYSFLSVSLTEPNANYTVSFATDGGMDKFVIDPYHLHVTSSKYVKTYGDQDPLFTQTFEGVNNETVQVNFDRDKTNSLCENVGIYDFIYINLSDNNYEVSLAAEGGKEKLEIIPLKVSVEIENKTSYFGHPLISLTWRLAEDSAQVIGDDNLNIVLTKEQGIETGSYVISGVADNENYEVEFNNGSYSIVILPVKYTVFFFQQDADSENYRELPNLRVKHTGADTTMAVYSPDNELFYGFEVNYIKSVLEHKLNAEDEANALMVYYSRKEFALNIDDGGGNIVTDKNSFLFGNKLNFNVPEKEGYDFIGWYVDGELIENDTLNYNRDITLEARWKLKEFKIVFETNGGTQVEHILLKYGDVLPESLKACPKKDAVFEGWYIDEACTVPANLNGSANEDIVLYAKWQEKKIDAGMYIAIGFGVLVLGVALTFLFKKKY